MNYLSEAEDVELRKAAKNDILMAALKKVFLEDLYAYGVLKEGKDPDPTRNFAFSFLYDPTTGQEYKLENEELGARLRASLEGIRLVYMKFKKLETLKLDSEPKKEEPNQAR